MDLDNFWQDGVSPNLSLSDILVMEAEKRYGCKLPALYLTLLKMKNGYWTNNLIFPTNLPTTYPDDHVGFEYMNGIGINNEWGSGEFDIFETEYMTEEWGLPANIILLCGDGHWWIALDYRRSKEAQVSWIDCEVDEDFILANTFEDFVKGLRSNYG